MSLLSLLSPWVEVRSADVGCGPVPKHILFVPMLSALLHPSGFKSADDNLRYRQKPPPSFSKSDETAPCQTGDNIYSQRMILVEKIYYIYLNPLPSCFLFFKIGSQYIAKAGLKLDILLPQPPEC